MSTLTFYGAAGEIGGPQILLEDPHDTRVFLDFGERPEQKKKFFGGFTQPRWTYGLLDFIQYELVPWRSGKRLDIYRNDFLELAGLPKHEQPNVDAVLLSHPHLDHYGAFPVLDERIPIYWSKGASNFIRGTQSVSRKTWSTRITGYEEKGAHLDFDVVVGYWDKEPGADGKPTKMRKEKTIGLFELPVWGSDKKVKRADTGQEVVVHYSAFPDFGNVKIDGKETSRSHQRTFKTTTHYKINDIEVRTFPVDHCDGATSMLIQTPDALIAYSGDIRMHGRDRKLTLDFLEEASREGVDVAIFEGTRMQVEDEPNKTEAQVAAEIKREIENQERNQASYNVRSTFVDVSYHDLEREEILIDVAEALGKKVAMPPKHAAFMYRMRIGGFVEKSVPKFTETRIREFVDVYKMRKGHDNPDDYEPYENFVYDHFNRITEVDIQRDQSKYIVVMSIPQLLMLGNFRPAPGSLFISSKPAAWDTESQAVEDRIENYVQQFGLAPPKRIHTHHHAPKEDLIKMLEIINPRTIIPMHTNNPQMYLDEIRKSSVLKDKRVVLPGRGKEIYLGSPRLTDSY